MDILLYWLFLNADRFRTKLFQPIPVAPDVIFTSIWLSWGRGSPVFNVSKTGATHFGQQPAIWSYFAGILPMARIANIFHTPILPVVAEVLIYLLYATVG